MEIFKLLRGVLEKTGLKPIPATTLAMLLLYAGYLQFYKLPRFETQNRKLVNQVVDAIAAIDRKATSRQPGADVPPEMEDIKRLRELRDEMANSKLPSERLPATAEEGYRTFASVQLEAKPEFLLTAKAKFGAAVKTISAPMIFRSMDACKLVAPKWNEEARVETPWQCDEYSHRP